MTGPQLEESAGFDRTTIDYIQRAAATGGAAAGGAGSYIDASRFGVWYFKGCRLSSHCIQ